jgi:uncharacterized protein YunC (DUF1805 family)
MVIIITLENVLVAPNRVVEYTSRADEIGVTYGSRE